MSSNQNGRRGRSAAAGALLLAVAAAAGGQTGEPTPPMARLPDIDPARLLSLVTTLASDEFEGRFPGTAGEERTVAFLVDQFKGLGLEPGNTDGSFVQNVPLVGITPQPVTNLTFTPLTRGPGRPAPTKRSESGHLSSGGTSSPERPDAATRAGSGEPAPGARTDVRSTTLRWREDYVAFSPRIVDEAAIEKSELVFIGYGVEAPEFDWDDYKGVDLTGKTVVVLIGDPPVPDPIDPSKPDAKTFGGRAMTYYGRWTYKYEMGAKKKVAGVLIVHEAEPAGYPWGVVKGFADKRFDLRTPDRNLDHPDIEGWITLAAARSLFATGGHDYDALKKKAATRQFAPVPLGVSVSATLRNSLQKVDSRNVVARLDGADAALRDEYVVYTAHWDHLGIGEAANGDRIYNGAVDNATGTAGLIEIARGFTRLAAPPRRSIVFLAVTAEEQGLLGAEYYAEHPIHPLEKTLANINLDGLNVVGRTSDVTVIGLGNSDLDDYLRTAAAEQRRTLSPDAEPEKGLFYRSDHFNFAKKGVPALYIDDGVRFIGKPEGYAKQVRDDYTSTRYHKPQDEVLPMWDLTGAADDLKLLLAVGLRVANATRWPEWKPGSEFKARRDAMLK